MSGVTVLTKEFDRLAQRNTEILNTDEGEGKSLGESAEILAEFEANTARMLDLKSGMEKASEFEALNKWSEQPATRAAVPVDDPSITDNGVASATVAGKRRTPGRQLVEHPAFKAFLHEVAPDGRLSENSSVKSAKFEVKDLITGAATSGGAMFETDVTGIYVPFVQPALTVRDLVLNLRTDADLVEYFRAVSHVNVAAAVLEATTAADITVGDSTGAPVVAPVTAVEAGLKPDAAFTWEKITEAVQPIAEGVPISKRSLMNSTMLQDIVDNQLRYDVSQTLNTQMISGPGTGATFTGIRNTAGIQVQAFSSNIIETLRKAKTKVTNPATGSGRVPNGAVLTPTAMETLDLFRVGGSTTTDGAFLVNPYGVAPRSIWGMSLVEEPGMTAGKAIVGFFRDAVLWDRQQTTVEVFDQHKDFAMRNMVQLLCEWWGTFGVLQPKSFVDAATA